MGEQLTVNGVIRVAMLQNTVAEQSRRIAELEAENEELREDVAVEKDAYDRVMTELGIAGRNYRQCRAEVERLQASAQVLSERNRWHVHDVDMLRAENTRLGALAGGRDQRIAELEAENRLLRVRVAELEAHLVDLPRWSSQRIAALEAEVKREHKGVGER